MIQNASIHIGRDASGCIIVQGAHNNISIAVHSERFLAEEEVGTPQPLGPNPYRGLAAFQEEDHEVFAGRDVLTKRIWERVARFFGVGETGRFLAVLGPSGSGKSSLVRAGLMPALARRAPYGVSKVNVAVMTPTGDPIGALGHALARVATAEASPAKAREFTDEISRTGEGVRADGLQRVATSISPGGESRLLLLIDQFEEIYTMCGKDEQAQEARDTFVATILDAAADSSARVSVIITLRSDFLGETHRHSKLSQWITECHELVLMMNQDELRRAITEPARHAGYEFDAATVELLIREVEGRAGALPLLQYALTRIWQGLGDQKQPMETLREVGGVGGALADRAEDIYHSLSEPQQAIARRAFLAMVQFGEGVQDTRRRVRVRDLVARGDEGELVRTVLRKFAQTSARLVTLSTSSETGDSLPASDGAPAPIEMAEVTHETLLRHWAELQGWIATGRDNMRFHRRLTEAANNWLRHDRADGLLWRPPDLDLLRKYFSQHPHDMSESEAEFFDASDASAKHEQKREKAALLRTRIALIAMAVLSTGGLGVFAIRIQRESLLGAEHQRQAAIAVHVGSTVNQALLDVAEATHRVGRIVTEARIAEDDVRLDLAKDEIARADDLNEVAVYGPDGVFIDAVRQKNAPDIGGRPQRLPGDVMTAEFMTRCSEGCWLPPKLTHTNDGWSVLMRYLEPIRGGGESRGWLLSTMSTAMSERLRKISQDHTKTPDGVVIVDAMTRVLIGPTKGPLGVGNDLRRDAFSNVRGLNEFSFRHPFTLTNEFRATSGEELVSSIVTLPEQGWAVVVRQPSETVFFWLANARRLFIGASLIVAIVATLLAFVLAPRIARARKSRATTGSRLRPSG